MFSICISETCSAAEKAAHPMYFTMLTICWVFLTAVKSHISYLPRYSERATFVPLKAAEAKFFGHQIEDKAFLLQKPSIRSNNTKASAAVHAMMLSQQSWQFSSMHWSRQRWSTFEQHLQKQDTPNSLSSPCKPTEPSGCKKPKLGPGHPQVWSVSAHRCEHRSVAKHIWGGQEAKRVQWCLKL